MHQGAGFGPRGTGLDCVCCDTCYQLLRWYGHLITAKYDGSKSRSPGRPPTTKDIRELMVRVAQEKAIRYAFLAPDIVRAIVDGCQLVGLTSDSVASNQYLSSCNNEGEPCSSHVVP